MFLKCFWAKILNTGRCLSHTRTISNSCSSWDIWRSGPPCLTPSCCGCVRVDQWWPLHRGMCPWGSPHPLPFPLSSQLGAICYWACAVLFPIVRSVSWHVCLSKVGNHKIILREIYMFYGGGSQWKFLCFFCGKMEIIVLNGYWCLLASFLHVNYLTPVGIGMTLWNLIVTGSKKCLFPVCAWCWPLGRSNLWTATWSHYTLGQNFLEKLKNKLDHTLSQVVSPASPLSFWCGSFFIVGLSCASRTLSTVPGLYSLGASRTPSPQLGQWKMSPDIPKCLLAGKIAPGGELLLSSIVAERKCLQREDSDCFKTGRNWSAHLIHLSLLMRCELLNY